MNNIEYCTSGSTTVAVKVFQKYVKIFLKYQVQIAKIAPSSSIVYQFLVFLALKLSFDSLCNLKWANLPEIIIVQLHATEKIS